MSLDPEILKQLIGTFKTELQEQTQLIVNNLLALEKGVAVEEERKKIVEGIFRAAHNLKGASRGLGIMNVGDIAHRIESLFSSLQKSNTVASSEIIDLCLEAIDKMHEAMQAYIDKTDLKFDLGNLLEKMEKYRIDSSNIKKNETPENQNVTKEKTYSHINSDESVRVAIDKLDKVSSLMEEIQVNKISIDDHYSELTHLVNQMKQFSSIFKRLSQSLNQNKLFYAVNDSFHDIKNTTEQLHKKMHGRMNELSILSNSLQEEVRMLRLVPAGNLVCTLPRYVRDLSKELNKSVELHVHGDEVKMDKMVLEGLKDPINHLLRNAIDHGIETSEIRKSLGKSEIGQITLDIREEGGQIYIELSDDGSGIDIKKIQEIAKNKNLVTDEGLVKMNDNDILDFIFMPGFTTKEIITSVSGRGVGLDVVKANLSDLKGDVKVTTNLGKGTTFSLRVPLTLATQRGLLLKCAGQLFVVPTISVEHVVAIAPSDIVDVEGSQAIILDNRPIPFRTLEAVLGYEANTLINQNRFSVIVVKKGWKSISFLVDEILGEREIVIKPLQAPLGNVPCVAGGTLLENSQIVIVLNPSDLIKLAANSGARQHISLNTQEQPTVVAKPHILIADDSITTRTLEKSILESRDYQVTVTANGKEAWDLLQKQAFTLLITDVDMPILDGFSLTEQVKKNDKLKNMPVIIVTSLGSDAEKKRGIDVGADAYIIKNEFESGKLLEVVAQLI